MDGGEMPGRVLWQTLKRRAMIEIPKVLEQGHDICNRDLHTIQKNCPGLLLGPG